MNEKDFLQKIKNDAENLTPPASLQPEAIEKMLQNHQETAENSACQNKTADFVPPKRKKKKMYRTFAKYGSLAAVLALTIAVLYQNQHIIAPKDNGQADNMAVQEETKLQVKDTDATQDGSADTILGKTAAEGADTEALMENADTTQEKAAAGGTDEIQTKSATPDKDAAASQNDTPQFTEAFTYADNPESIYNALYERFYQNSGDKISGYGNSISRGQLTTAEMSMEDGVAMDMSMSMDTGSSKAVDFSETNLQEIGVDEGDIVKTDGEYIYILRQDLSLAIIKANGKSSETVSMTSLGASENASVREMYLDGDMLNVIISEYVTSLETQTGDSASDATNDIYYYTDSRRQAKLLTFDISDRTSPVLTGTVTQEGSYETSRKNGRYVYLFTSYYPNLLDTYEGSTIMPRLNGTEASAGDVFLPDSLSDSSYLVISSVDTATPDSIQDSKILVSGVSNYYVSTKNIYIANETYNSGQAMTEITKFHYSDGEIIGVAAASVKGYLNNSFSMNEYDGNLRVVSTYTGDEFNTLRDLASNVTGKYYEQNWTEHNALYVFDETMQQIGAIEGLADGETIRSARFFGDTGYFVTFRQTDPLFSVDLSDPTNPKILGELKVSGFSSYLHFYGENLLLGIGYDANEDTGMTTGLKLSMFDISDPSNVTEVNRLVLPGITWCPAIEDYKSILVQPEKNLIGFYCDNRYLAFSYDPEQGFVSELVYDFYSDMLVGQVEYNTMRGLYIEDTFYLAGNTFLITFDMDKDFEKTGVISLDANESSE